MILEKVTRGLRGELSRWMIEPHPGVFVGHVNALVRDKLWEKCCQKRGAGGIIQIWSSNNEQHFLMRISGNAARRLVEFEGLQLIEIPAEKEGKSEISGEEEE